MRTKIDIRVEKINIITEWFEKIPRKSYNCLNIEEAEELIEKLEEIEE